MCKCEKEKKGKPFVIWFEGPDKVWKSTIADYLRDASHEFGFLTKKIHFPLYSLVETEEMEKATSVSLMLKLLEEFKQLKDSKPPQNTDVVVFDRSPLSTAVYNVSKILKINDNDKKEKIKALALFSSPFFSQLPSWAVPDVVFFFLPNIYTPTELSSTEVFFTYELIFENWETFSATLAVATNEPSWFWSEAVIVNEEGFDDTLSVVLSVIWKKVMPGS